jgi:hypothetical protein
MKITLDIDKLLAEQSISRDEYDRLKALAARSTSSLAFNILIGFGVIAVSGAALALVPAAGSAVVIGLGVLVLGLLILRRNPRQWAVLANICILVGALMAGGGIVALGEGGLPSILAVTALFAAAGIFAGSSLLAVLATLMLSTGIGARTGYFHASYFLVIREPALTVVVFSLLAAGLYYLSRTLTPAYERLAVAASRTSLFLVNLGFWVGSLWGDRFGDGQTMIPDAVFSLLWAGALVATGIWAWQRNRRWVLNTVAVFGGIHFYTQWFETLGASPGTVLIAGLLALAFAAALRSVNGMLKAQA